MKRLFFILLFLSQHSLSSLTINNDTDLLLYLTFNDIKPETRELLKNMKIEEKAKRTELNINSCYIIPPHQKLTFTEIVYERILEAEGLLLCTFAIWTDSPKPLTTEVPLMESNALVSINLNTNMMLSSSMQRCRL